MCAREDVCCALRARQRTGVEEAATSSPDYVRLRADGSLLLTVMRMQGELLHLEGRDVVGGGKGIGGHARAARVRTWLRRLSGFQSLRLEPRHSLRNRCLPASVLLLLLTATLACSPRLRAGVGIREGGHF